MNSRAGLRFALRWLVWVSVILFGALACSIPLSPVTGTATLAATIVPTVAIPSATPTRALPAPTAIDEGPVAPETGEVLIYLVAVGDNGASGKPVGCGDSLVAVKRQIAPTRQAIAAALNELFAIKQQYFGESGLYNALYQSNLTVERAIVDENGIATVVLTGQVMLGGTCDTPRFKGQIEETIRSIGGVQSANIFLNGKTIDEALSQR